jgi:hypothetical protein
MIYTVLAVLIALCGILWLLRRIVCLLTILCALMGHVQESLPGNDGAEGKDVTPYQRLLAVWEVIRHYQSRQRGRDYI